MKVKLLYLFWEEWELVRIPALMLSTQIDSTALNSHIFTLVSSKSEQYTYLEVEV